MNFKYAFNRFKDFYVKACSYFLPNESLDIDVKVGMTIFNGIQIPVCVTVAVLAPVFWSFHFHKFFVSVVLYGTGCLTTLFLNKFNKRIASLIVAIIGVTQLLIAGSILLGTQSAFWDYYIISLVCSNFFIFQKTKKSLKIWGNSTLILAFILSIVLTWFQVFPTEVTDENRLFVLRLGVFNIVFASTMAFGFVTYFYSAMTGFRAQLEKQAEVLQEQLNLVSSILNSMKQAIFAVDSSKKVVAPVSLFTETIFKDRLEGKNINKILLEGTENTEYYSRFNSTLDLIFDEDELAWEMHKSNLPKKLDVKLNEEIRNLNISFSDMRSKDGLLEKLLLVVEDVTELQQLEETIRKQKHLHEREAQILQQVYSLNSNQLEMFIKNGSRLIKELDAAIENLPTDLNGLSLILRNLHTLKGNARAAGFNLLSSLVHETESLIEDKNLKQLLLSADSAANSNLFEESQLFLHAHKEKVESLFNEYHQIASKFLGSNKSIGVGLNSGSASGNQDDRLVAFYRVNYNRLSAKLNELEEKGSLVSVSEFKREFDRLNEVPLLEVLEHQNSLVSEMEKSLGKQINYSFNSDYITVPEKLAHAFEDMITHLLRNAADHGLESRDYRISIGKDPIGKIEVNFVVDDEYLHLYIHDDGRGINSNAVGEKALRMGLVTATELEQMSEAEKLKLILKEGFSTASQVSEYSGRGVGMSAVEGIVKTYGGKIEIRSELGKGSTFHFLVPNSAIIELRNNINQFSKSSAKLSAVI